MSAVPVANAGASDVRTCVAPIGCVSYASSAGVPNGTEPSGMAPPGAGALPGFVQSYVTDFTGSSLPAGWSTFNGVPGGDAGTMFAPSQSSVANGELRLTATLSPLSHEWLTGGVCLCSAAQTYGAFFVRSRLTGPGPTVAELLWPHDGTWPPEIDFNETYGGTSGSMATVHFGSNNSVDHRKLVIDMTQWHTWGVVWTATSLIYLVDGNVWGSVSSPVEIPREAMTLDIQQQTWCSHGFACSQSPQSTLVDWAVQYTILPDPGASPTTQPVAINNAPTTQKVSPTHIAINANLPSSKLTAIVRSAALTIRRLHAHTVTVKAMVTAPGATVVASPARRVRRIERMLKNDLRALGTVAPRILVHWSRVALNPLPLLQLFLTFGF